MGYSSPSLPPRETCRSWGLWALKFLPTTPLNYSTLVCAGLLLPATSFTTHPFRLLLSDICMYVDIKLHRTKSKGPFFETEKHCTTFEYLGNIRALYIRSWHLFSARHRGARPVPCSPDPRYNKNLISEISMITEVSVHSEKYYNCCEEKLAISDCFRSCLGRFVGNKVLLWYSSQRAVLTLHRTLPFLTALVSMWRTRQE